MRAATVLLLICGVSVTEGEPASPGDAMLVSATWYSIRKSIERISVVKKDVSTVLARATADIGLQAPRGVLRLTGVLAEGVFREHMKLNVDIHLCSKGKRVLLHCDLSHTEYRVTDDRSYPNDERQTPAQLPSQQSLLPPCFTFRSIRQSTMGGSLDAFQIYLDIFKVRDEPRLSANGSTVSSFLAQPNSLEGEGSKVAESKTSATGEVTKEVGAGSDSGYESENAGKGKEAQI